jgi:hypothetical protein
MFTLIFFFAAPAAYFVSLAPAPQSEQVRFYPLRLSCESLFSKQLCANINTNAQSTSIKLIENWKNFHKFILVFFGLVC